MKLPPLLVLFLLPPVDELLSPSLPNSVCGRKKNQPQGLASSSSGSITLTSSLTFPPAAEFHPRLMFSSSLLKLQISSNPA